MEGDEFLSDILMNNEVDGDPVISLDDINVPITQDLVDDSEVQPIEVEVQATGGSKGASKRTKNFSFAEDEVIIKGWLLASKDPINGANQSRGRFWGKVHDYFEKNKTTHIDRTESSVLHRWLTIQTQVNKFCSCLDAIFRRNQSGMSIQDKMAEATRVYEGLGQESKKFAILPCWNMLKNEDKWKLKRKELAALEKAAATNKNKKKSTKQSRPREEDERHIHESDEASPDSEKSKRPEGVKKAKAALKQGGDACKEALEMMWAKKEAFDKEKKKAKHERFIASLEIDKAALELDKERVQTDKLTAEAKLMKEEDKIMSVNMSTLEPTQRQYYEMMQQKIMARRLQN